VAQVHQQQTQLVTTVHQAGSPALQPQAVAAVHNKTQTDVTVVAAAVVATEQAQAV